MPLLRHLDLPEFTDLAVHAASITQPCSCQQSRLAGWASMPLSLPDTQLLDVGTLAETDPEDASYEEFLPAGTNYWSDNAPIAVRHFPYNRCAVSECLLCKRLYLRYTEGGGYFVDRRIRQVDPALIADHTLG
jgi:hypothetical protein